MANVPRGGAGLWRRPDFLRLWCGQSISELGSQVSQLAVPLVAAGELRATPLEFSLLGVAGFVPFILLALPAGAWVDRTRRRHVLIVGDASRALLLAAVPVLWALGELRMWELLALQLALGTFTVFFDVAYQSYVPSLVEPEHLVEANSRLQFTVALAQVGGPGLSGALVAAFTAPYAVAADAVSYVISAGFMLRMKHREAGPERLADGSAHQLWDEVKEGLRWVSGHPWLRAVAASTAVYNFFSNVAFAIFILYLVRALHLSSLQVGLLLALGACGALVGAAYAARAQRHLGVGPTIVLAAALGGVANFAYPLAPASWPAPVLVLGLALGGFATVIYNITQVSLRQAITPQRLQGRMNAAMRWIVWGTIPLGSLMGGVVAQACGMRFTLWLGAAGGMLAVLPVALGSVRRVGAMPAPPGLVHASPG